MPRQSGRWTEERTASGEGAAGASRPSREVNTRVSHKWRSEEGSITQGIVRERLRERRREGDGKRGGFGLGSNNNNTTTHVYVYGHTHFDRQATQSPYRTQQRSKHSQAAVRNTAATSVSAQH
jgi:hypothetical protein